MHFHGLKSLNLTASLDTTAVPGILTNSTDDPIASNNRQDYSFKPHEDTPDPITLVYDGTAGVGSRLTGSDLPSSFYYDDTPQHDGSHGAIVLKVWCKDFGGNCEITFTSGTAEFWGVTGSLDFSGLTVEVPFTYLDRPVFAAHMVKWVKEELGTMETPGESTWGKIYGTAFDDERKELLYYTARGNYPLTDKEPKDPDKPGEGMPEHLCPGDGFKIDEEYRGFFLAGGGFDEDGERDWRMFDWSLWGPMPTYTARLSPARKELVVEVDAMAFVPEMPVDERAFMVSVMDRVSKGFSNRINGCGARLLYLIQDTDIVKVCPWDAGDRDKILFGDPPAWNGSKSKDLFLCGCTYLIMTENCLDHPDALGVAYEGAFLHVTKTAGFIASLRNSLGPEECKRYEDAGYTFQLDDWCARVAAHEMTHLLLDRRNAPPFDAEEHLTEDAHRQHVMYPSVGLDNVRPIMFSDETRVKLNFVHKEGSRYP